MMVNGLRCVSKSCTMHDLLVNLKSIFDPYL
jgi:hypothetical protein